jgi:hypothetical protein
MGPTAGASDAAATDTTPRCFAAHPPAVPDATLLLCCCFCCCHLLLLLHTAVGFVLGEQVCATGAHMKQRCQIMIAVLPAPHDPQKQVHLHDNDNSTIY